MAVGLRRVAHLAAPRELVQSSHIMLVTVYNAKTHLSRLLDAVSEERRSRITRHGHPVARLVPVVPEGALRSSVAFRGKLRVKRR